MKRITAVIILIVLITVSVFAQVKRYKDEIFASYLLQSNITYGTGSKNTMDIYTGTGDVSTNRPLVIFIHGGGFKDGDKVSSFGTRVCGGLAKRGYVVASINYRLTPTQNTNQQSFEAMIKAVQDAKAAVRYFRKNASLYGIDATQIFATGSSAGCITALHMAYLDAAELPSYVVDPILKDLEGTSGNPGYSSNIQGVISNWGAIGDTTWMKNNNVPVYCVHGTSDQTVFFEQVPADGPFEFGSKHIFTAAQRLNLKSGLRIFNNTGHTLDNSSTKQDSAYKDFSQWLYTILNVTTDIKAEKNSIPSTFVLHQNYPNPFNPVSNIKFEIPVGAMVNLTVYDILGNEVETLVNQYMEQGVYQKIFDAKNLSSGIYFYKLTAQNMVHTKTMTLLK